MACILLNWKVIYFVTPENSSNRKSISGEWYKEIFPNETFLNVFLNITKYKTEPIK